MGALTITASSVRETETARTLSSMPELFGVDEGWLTRFILHGEV
jgi:hypothetical protein